MIWMFRGEDSEMMKEKEQELKYRTWAQMEPTLMIGRKEEWRRLEGNSTPMAAVWLFIQLGGWLLCAVSPPNWLTRWLVSGTKHSCVWSSLFMWLCYSIWKLHMCNESPASATSHSHLRKQNDRELSFLSVMMLGSIPHQQKRHIYTRYGWKQCYYNKKVPLKGRTLFVRKSNC